VSSPKKSKHFSIFSLQSALSWRSEALLPKSARRGNLLGALGAVVGVATVFLAEELSNVALILIVIAVGSAISVPASRMVKMTQMPQLVALFNGVGGGAAAVVAYLELGAADSLGFKSLWPSPFSSEAFLSRAPSLRSPNCKK